MRKLQWRVLALMMTVVMIAGVMPAAAQDASNLLVNGGLEEASFGPYIGRRGGDFPIYLPNGWNYWFAAPTGDRTNRAERATIQPHPGPGPNPYEGGRAMNVDCGFFSCTAAVFQQVGSIQPGSPLTASAWSQVKACNLGGGTSCGSARESGSQTRIGIDPTGGTDPNNPAIVWSGFVQPHDQWLQQTVSATASGATVTVFLYSTQSAFADLNKTYWDSVVLTGTTVGAGTALPGAPTAAPTAPPFVQFVVPQGEQPDGSIIHTVQAGDTIDSIAYAYGLTRKQLMDLNQLQSANFIFPGQKLIIKPADTAAAAESTSEAVPETTAEQPVAVAVEATSVPATTAPQLEPTAAPPAEATTAPVEPTAEQPAQPPGPTAVLPTAPVVVAQAGEVDPSVVTAQVCVTLFDDANQNRIQEPGEALLAGGTIDLQQDGAAVATYQTDGVGEPHCFDSLAAGDYVAVGAAPSGYGLTTPDQLRVRLNAGARIDLTYGAAEGVQPAQPLPADAGSAPAEPSAETAAPQTLAEQILSMSGLIVFGLAALVLVGGIGASLLLRRR